MTDLLYWTLALNILAVGVSVGTLLTTVRWQGKDIERLQSSDQRQWKVLDEHGRGISFLEGNANRPRK